MTITTGPAPGSIVVGVDGSPAADLALDWAARTAEVEHRALTIINAAHLSAAVGDGVFSGTGVDCTSIFAAMRTTGEEILAVAAKRARGVAPTITIEQVLTTRDPREELLALAEHANLIVVGSRGRGTIASLLLGSVSVTVSTHATCPVVVVRPNQTSEPRNGILVDADGTEESLAAVEFAYRTASIRNLPLTVVHVFWDGVSLVADNHEVADDELGLVDQRMLLSESVAGMREKFPDVQDRTVLMPGSTDRELIALSRGMDLLVIGKRHPGFFGARVAFGVTPAVVEHAWCDVAVIPPVSTLPAD